MARCATAGAGEVFPGDGDCGAVGQGSGQGGVGGGELRGVTVEECGRPISRLILGLQTPAKAIDRCLRVIPVSRPYCGSAKDASI